MTELQGLRIRDLTVRYGGILAVDKVDLDVPTGTITGLIGPNGAGKSSLFSACSGDVPAHGSVVLFGRDISHMGPVRRARAGYGRCGWITSFLRSTRRRASSECPRARVHAF